PPDEILPRCFLKGCSKKSEEMKTRHASHGGPFVQTPLLVPTTFHIVAGPVKTLESLFSKEFFANVQAIGVLPAPLVMLQKDNPRVPRKSPRCDRDQRAETAWSRLCKKSSKPESCA